jgi:hypothetical protein
MALQLDVLLRIGDLMLLLAMAPPLGLDPFTNIINVHWGGLAVEFHDGSGSSELPTA